MGTPFKALKVAENIYWVGAIDWAVREFHGYKTGRGTTYNAYLVLGEKITLIDTVKSHFKDELISRIIDVIGDLSKIDIIISNHAEMDHSGCLPELIALAKPEKVYASPKGVDALKAHFHHDALDIIAVKEGDEACISGQGAEGGPMTVKFMQTPLLHWPDSMFSYIPERKALFCQDAFGMHLAGGERFAEDVPDWLLEEEAGRYFANILLPFSAMVPKLFDRVEKAGMDIEIAFPDHGPIWREKFPKVVEWYKRWASHKPTNKAVVVFDTMWESTDVMARALTDGLIAAGAQVKVFPLAGSHRSEIATELLDAGALIVGSPTLNTQMYPTVADALCYLKGLKRKNLVGAVFGSYGWSGEGVKHVEEALTEMGVELIGVQRTQFVPGDSTLEDCRALGVKVGERLAALNA